MVADTPPRKETDETVFKVVDALDHPHGGRLLRVRLRGGSPPPPVGQIRGKHLRAVGPDGTESSVRVLGFSLIGGRVSNRRLEKTGRLDLHVEESEGRSPVSLRWLLYLD
jgi:hypothetical protein